MALRDVEMDRVGMQRAIVELGQQYTPRHALREYVTNAIDAIDEARAKRGLKAGLIQILLQPHPNSPRIVIQDNASGISHERLRELPLRVGNSVKQGKIDQRGEKAIGLLAFLSLTTEEARKGTQMHLISKMKEEKYGYVRYEFDGNRVRFEPDLLIRGDADMRNFGGPIRVQGTKVVLDIDPMIFNQHFKPEQVRAMLRETYWPILEKGYIDFLVGVDKGALSPEMKLVKSFDMSGDEIFKGKLPFMAKRQGESVSGEVYAHLWFDAESDAGGAIGVYSKGVQVHRSVLGLEDSKLASCSLWRCKHIRGYVEEPHLALTLGKDRIKAVKESNMYRGFIEQLYALDTRLWHEIESKIEHQSAHRGTKRLQEIVELIRSGWRTLTPPPYRKPRAAGPYIHLGVPDPRQKPGEGGKKPEEDGGSNGTPKRGPKFPVEMVELRSFGMNERDLRSRLEMVADNPVVHINRLHPDFVEIFEHDHESLEAAEYVIRQVVYPVAAWEIDKATREAGVRYEDVSEQIEAVRQRADNAFYHLWRIYLSGKK